MADFKNPPSVADEEINRLCASIKWKANYGMKHTKLTAILFIVISLFGHCLMATEEKIVLDTINECGKFYYANLAGSFLSSTPVYFSYEDERTLANSYLKKIINLGTSSLPLIISFLKNNQSLRKNEFKSMFLGHAIVKIGKFDLETYYNYESPLYRKYNIDLAYYKIFIEWYSNAWIVPCVPA
ncbi:MAG: hypothetical protein CVV64_19520 [Candidatus Wallbacteria bacterium HGW-Wallbacteria-1]|jgi:hypothetical protein|uniref:Uncharacterized protein n=1 Tax=Candidatus Wallbacteria bacterium HGW-Wallbacteria-1 TaxID=2013854 RepID=A0A2N1PIT6_9BACT|nr:MAG: hypothetical protein CVV64_19520 [Candidatus Wallbacteria bacterium HGW-Wallbacteria-1]